MNIHVLTLTQIHECDVTIRVFSSTVNYNTWLGFFWGFFVVFFCCLFLFIHYIGGVSFLLCFGLIFFFNFVFDFIFDAFLFPFCWLYTVFDSFVKWFDMLWGFALLHLACTQTENQPLFQDMLILRKFL